MSTGVNSLVLDGNIIGNLAESQTWLQKIVLDSPHFGFCELGRGEVAGLLEINQVLEVGFLGDTIIDHDGVIIFRRDEAGICFDANVFLPRLELLD